MLSVICGAASVAPDNVGHNRFGACKLLRQRNSSQQVDIFRTAQQRVKAANVEERLTCDQRGLQWNPLPGHYLKETVSFQPVSKLYQGSAFAVDELSGAVYPRCHLSIGQFFERAQGIWGQPIVIVQKVQVPSSRDGGAGISCQAPLAPVRVNDPNVRRSLPGGATQRPSGIVDDDHLKIRTVQLLIEDAPDGTLQGRTRHRWNNR